MKIVRIFNNNIVSTLDEEENELIVQGAGVGFNKKSGDAINPSSIEKIFHLRDTNFGKYQQFFDQVPIEYFEVAEIIMKKAEESLRVNFKTQSILALADHIYQAVEREKNGNPIANLMLDEIKILYRDEFEISYWALGIIQKHLGISLSEDEAGYITLHIVNANTHIDAGLNTKILRFTRGVMDLIKINLSVDLNPDDYNTTRLLTHLKFLSLRIFNEENQSLEVMDDMYDILIRKDDRLRTCLDQIGLFTNREFSYTFTRSEEIYLMVHLLKII